MSQRKNIEKETGKVRFVLTLNLDNAEQREIFEILNRQSNVTEYLRRCVLSAEKDKPVESLDAVKELIAENNERLSDLISDKVAESVREVFKERDSRIDTSLSDSV